MKPNHLNRFRITSLLAVTGFFAMSVGAHAASNTWVGDTNVWDTGSATNWTSPTTWTSGDDAVFGAPGGGGLSLALTTVSAHNIDFNTTGYSLTGSSLTLTGTTPTITTAPDVSASISSVILGSAGLRKAGTGTLNLTGENTYTGGTTINGGTLALSGGNNRLLSTGTVNFGGTGTLDIGSTNQSLGALNSSTAATATNTVTGTGTLTATNITVNTAVNTTATMEFGTLNSSLTVNATNMTVASAGSGAPGTPTLTANANFIGNTNATIATVTVGLNTRENKASTSMNAVGSLTMGSGTLTATNLIIGQDTSGTDNYTLAANTQGTFTTGAGTVKVTTLTMGDKRSAVGLNTVNSIFNLSNGGTLEATTIKNGADANTRVTRTFNWNNGTITNLGATNLVISSNTSDTTPAAALTIKLADSGMHTFDIVSGQTGTVSARLVDATTGGTLNKAGAGTLTLGAVNTYTGTTTVSDGTLVISGSISTSVLTTVNGTGTLGGTGTVGALTVATGGTLAPGNSPGILNAGHTDLQSGSNFNVELNGPIAGTDYDQLNVSGTVTLAGALNLTIGSTPVNGELFFILANDGADAIDGTFSGLADGHTFSASGQDFQISYFGNYDSVTPANNSFTGGNDVVLMAIPEPAAAFLGSLGMLVLLRRRRA